MQWGQECEGRDYNVTSEKQFLDVAVAWIYEKKKHLLTVAKTISAIIFEWNGTTLPIPTSLPRSRF